ncbi:hypothetical protein E2C01_060339 [Portunus trituberculatus]|uniref:Uncharacterized protein n=1 Tax=Portunus trituberculatus TaxID=210409 RepID=A0A5B7H4Z0_PORTR|nr:hypothetical protein [Portunus trituberculatus]
MVVAAPSPLPPDARWGLSWHLIECANRCTAESGRERFQGGLKISGVTALCCSPVSVHNNGVEYPVTLEGSARAVCVWLAVAAGWLAGREGGRGVWLAGKIEVGRGALGREGELPAVASGCLLMFWKRFSISQPTVLEYGCTYTLPLLPFFPSLLPTRITLVRSASGTTITQSLSPEAAGVARASSSLASLINADEQLGEALQAG